MISATNESLINYDAPDHTREVISTIGRTEDVRLSPNNQRLAIADFLNDRIIILFIQIDESKSGPVIHFSDYSIILSDELKYPHGLAFLDEEHLITANRKGYVSIFKIPGASEASSGLKTAAFSTLKGSFASRISSPGSVECYQPGEGGSVVLVCNNYIHSVTSHRVEIGKELRVRRDRVIVRKGMKIPDGISVSFDRRWIAVSNHVKGEVWVYRNTKWLNRFSSPVGVLSGVVCPHGLRFSPDGKRLFVADAASSYLHVYESEQCDWAITSGATRSIQILDDETFKLGRNNPFEGGLKGIDIDSRGLILVSTCQHQTLRFHDLKKLLAQPSYNMPIQESTELCRQRDQAFSKYRSYNSPWRRLKRRLAYSRSRQDTMR
jgi:WD40 repeat protein